MSALFYSDIPDPGTAGSGLARLRAKFGPLAAVLGAHAVLFYAAYSGMLTRMVDAALPDAVLVSFVAPVAEVKPPPAAPKLVPVVQLPPPALPVVPVPEVQFAPQQNVITTVQSSAPAEVRPVPPPPAPVVAAAPAPAAVASTPRTITSGVEYVREPQPVYPQMSRRMGEQGRVMLRILINEKGRPEQALVHSSSGSPRLDEAGRQAALRAQFKPHMEDGRAVAVYVIVPVNFQLAS
ncbi:energy transducer TonB [Massilia sp. PAMC28688]|uniref:energy transducer TonB n=1 Tax=Massilia sp. PAMC28688 TaxID=2861283 RepID=UPI001C62915A|nr:energy transducer TonB [Massilia sp. PAMC28688]QYF95527.1 energy transducer TonB [Massilia sp. PAMC28688]